jgi:regulator of nucleoside diphosphate kinase
MMALYFLVRGWPWCNKGVGSLQKDGSSKNISDCWLQSGNRNQPCKDGWSVPKIYSFLNFTKMKTTEKEIIMTHDDYDTLASYVRSVRPVKEFDRKNAALLGDELKKAILVKRDELPGDVVRLNSRVFVQEGSKDKLIEMVLVVPEQANIQEKKVSVFAPLGTALIGFRQGEKVKWNVPSGNKTFTIVKVCN